MFGKLLDILFPPHCLKCGSGVEHNEVVCNCVVIEVEIFFCFTNSFQVVHECVFVEEKFFFSEFVEDDAVCRSKSCLDELVMQKPQTCLVFKKGVVAAFVVKKLGSKLCRVVFAVNDVECFHPVADGRNHVLTNSKFYNCIFVIEGFFGEYIVVTFLQPKLSALKGIMSWKSIFYRARTC